MSDLADDLVAPPRGAGPEPIRDDLDPSGAAPRRAPDGVGPTRALVEDIEALVDDARTYVDAELTYQKSRASFVADRVKKALVFGVAAMGFGLLAAIGLTVGLIIALTPLVTGWGATAIVVGLLLVVAFLLVRRAAGAWGEIQRVTGSDAKGAAAADKD